MAAHQQTPYTNPQTGRAEELRDHALIESQEITETGAGPVREIGSCSTVRGTLAVSDVAGTSPTLDVVIETRRDAAQAWRTLHTFAQVTADDEIEFSVGGADRQIRASWTVGGTTPTFTVALNGEYC